MTQISDQDWEALNALADHELPEEQAIALRARLEKEPALEREYASILSVSSALSSLKPSTEATLVAANDNRRPMMWASGAAIAAALALVVVWGTGEQKNPSLSTHQEYLTLTFEVGATTDLRAVASGNVEGFPSLSDANLVMAALRNEGATASAHYVGVNGCRLTMLRGVGELPASPSNIQVSQWNVGEKWYQVLASNMDQQKFDAVAQYLAQTTRHELKFKTVLALQGATSDAAPCA